MEQTAGSDFCRLASWQATVKITVSQTQTYDWCAHSMLPFSPSEILYIVYNIVRIGNKINIVKHYFTFFLHQPVPLMFSVNSFIALFTLAPSELKLQ